MSPGLTGPRVRFDNTINRWFLAVGWKVSLRRDGRPPAAPNVAWAIIHDPIASPGKYYDRSRR